MRHRDLGKPDGSGDLRHRPLVRRIAIAVHEDDGGGTDTGGVRGLQFGAGARLVERRQHIAVWTDALRHLDDAGVKHFRQDDLALEQLGSILIADA